MVLFIAIAVVVSLTTLTGVLFFMTGGFDRGGAQSEPDGAPNIAVPSAHQLPELVTELLPTELMDKDWGLPSKPDASTLEIVDDIAVVARSTDQRVHIEAQSLTSDAKAWEFTYESEERILGVELVAHSEAVVVKISFLGRQSDLILALSPQSGEELWDANAESSPKVLGDRIVFYSEERDELVAIGLADGQEIWSVPDDGGRTTLNIPSDSSSPGLSDPGRFFQLSMVDAADLPEDSWLGLVVNYSGVARTIDLATGEHIAEGSVGENATFSAASQDKLFTLAESSQDLRAYAYDALDSPLWTAKVPTREDGSSRLVP